jgi:hypothetical protein
MDMNITAITLVAVLGAITPRLASATLKAVIPAGVGTFITAEYLRAAVLGAITPWLASATLKAAIPTVMSYTGEVVAGVGTFHGAVTSAIQTMSVTLSAPSACILGAAIGVYVYARAPEIADIFWQMVNFTTSN